MIKQPITIINQLGLHARAAAKLVSTASKFSSNINIIYGTKIVNTKSIMGVMMLAAAKGSELVLEISGPDEENAKNAMVELINNKFGEEA